MSFRIQSDRLRIQRPAKVCRLLSKFLYIFDKRLFFKIYVNFVQIERAVIQIERSL